MVVGWWWVCAANTVHHHLHARQRHAMPWYSMQVGGSGGRYGFKARSAAGWRAFTVYSLNTTKTLENTCPQTQGLSPLSPTVS